MTEAKTAVWFRWTQNSPDSHNVTMRNTLEPINTFVEVEVPRKYFVNADELSEHRELEIQAEIVPDVESAGKRPFPILTVEGMRFVISQLSGGGSFEPEVEEEEWDDEDSTVSDDEWEEDNTVSTDEEWEDDEDFDDDWEE
jgi:hypothetical protein